LEEASFSAYNNKMDGALRASTKFKDILITAC